MAETVETCVRPRLPPSAPDVTHGGRRRVLWGIARTGLARCSPASSGADWLPLGRVPVRACQRTMRTVISLAGLKPPSTLVLPHIAPSTSNPLRRYDPLPNGATESRRASTLPRAAGRHRSRMAAGNTDEDPANGAARITDSTESAARPESGCARAAVQQRSPNIAAQLGSSRYTLPLLARSADVRRYSRTWSGTEPTVQELLDAGVADLRWRYPGTRRIDYWLPTEPLWQARTI